MTVKRTNNEIKDKKTTRKNRKSAIGETPSPSEDAVLPYLKHIAVVVGATLITIATFGNSLTWHLGTFRSASGNFWQAQWDKVLDTFGEDPFLYGVYGGVLYTLTTYWIFGSIFTIFDVTNKPAVLRKYKVQPGTNEPLDLKKLGNVAAHVLFNQTVVSSACAYVWFQAMVRRGLAPLRPLPPFHWLLLELVVFIATEEVLFYYSHRLLHHRAIYRFVHKKHHEWTAPFALVAVYCHPLEHAVANVFPVLSGPLLMGSHAATVFLWLTLALLFTLITHSGYHLPFLISPEDHDFHHLKFNYCFGVLGVMDRLHGTDAAFRKSAAYKRHRVLLSLTPARHRFPGK